MREVRATTGPAATGAVVVASMEQEQGRGVCAGRGPIWGAT
jgi:hypothetical protein